MNLCRERKRHMERERERERETLLFICVYICIYIERKRKSNRKIDTYPLSGILLIMYRLLLACWFANFCVIDCLCP